MIDTSELEGYISTECVCSEDIDCYGDCWDMMLDEFFFMLDDWFVPGSFRITGFPTWYGSVSGEFDAKTVMDFLNKITPDRTEFNLRYDIDDDGNFVGFLSHHDGSGSITVTKFVEPDCDGV